VEQDCTYEEMMALRPMCCDEDTWAIACKYKKPATKRFEVTIGGEKWKRLPAELQEAILSRARRYTGHLIDQLNEYAPSIHINEI
jgi:hypothetical protein